MKIRTNEHLVDRLSSELAWRRKELAVLRAMIQSNQGKQTLSQTMIRSGVTVLYAHWEGFVRAACSAYLEYVSRKRLRYCDISIPFLALAFKSKLNAVISSDRASIFIDATSFILNCQNEQCDIPWKDGINTKSNLSSKVLREIILLIGLDYSFYETKEKLIDQSLLYFRNNIAHGREIYPSHSLVMNLFHEIIDLMNILRNQIENAAATEQYKRRN